MVRQSANERARPDKVVMASPRVRCARELLVPAAIRRAAATIRLKFRARKLGGGDLLTHASRGARLLSQPHAEEGALAPVSKHGPQGRPLPSFETRPSAAPQDEARERARCSPRRYGILFTGFGSRLNSRAALAPRMLRLLVSFKNGRS